MHNSPYIWALCLRPPWVCLEFLVLGKPKKIIVKGVNGTRTTGSRKHSQGCFVEGFKLTKQEERWKPSLCHERPHMAPTCGLLAILVEGASPRPQLMHSVVFLSVQFSHFSPFQSFLA